MRRSLLLGFVVGLAMAASLAAQNPVTAQVQAALRSLGLLAPPAYTNGQVPGWSTATGKFIPTTVGGGGGGSGTVTSVSVTTANGVSGSVATSTTTPAITLSFTNIVATGLTRDAGDLTISTTGSGGNINMSSVDGYVAMTATGILFNGVSYINPNVNDLNIAAAGTLYFDAGSTMNFNPVGDIQLQPVSGHVVATADITATAFIGVPQVPVTAVASLPTCNGGSEGQMRGVNDALLPAALAIVANGGAVHVPVYCDGTNWRVM